MAAELDLDEAIRHKARLLVDIHNDPLVVQTNYLQKALRNFEYGEPVESNAGDFEIHKSSYTNDTDVIQKQNIDLVKEIAFVHSWTVTESVKCGSKVSLGVPKYATVDTSVELTFTEQETKTVTTRRTVTKRFDITIPARSRVDVVLVQRSAEMLVPFSADVVISGVLKIRRPPKVGPEDYGHLVNEGGIGILFNKYPNAQVKVLNEGAIACRVQGRFNGVRGEFARVVTRQYDLAGPGAPPVVNELGPLDEPG